MSTIKPSTPEPTSSPRRFPRHLTGLVIILFGAAISLHLYAHHVAHWWLPFVLLFLAHGLIISALVWLLARHHHGHAHDQPHTHQPASILLHAPRFYDWLVWFLALGHERQFRNHILDLANLSPGDAILDVGCGTGTLLRHAAPRIAPNGASHGIEASPEMIAHARRKAQSQRLPITFTQASADQLPFSDGAFDVIFCTLVLHHLPRDMQTAALAEMSRVLRRGRGGGRLVLVDLQRPPKIAAAFSLVTLFHRTNSHHTPPDWPAIDQVLKTHGFHSLESQSFWHGTVRILVAHASSSDGATT